MEKCESHVIRKLLSWGGGGQKEISGMRNSTSRAQRKAWEKDMVWCFLVAKRKGFELSGARLSITSRTYEKQILVSIQQNRILFQSEHAIQKGRMGNISYHFPNHHYIGPQILVHPEDV